MPEEKKKRVTFFTKNEIECPVCGARFRREELLTGGGRLIAGPVTMELRRVYEPSKQYGVVNPLLYPVTVCPDCYFAALKDDFNKIKPEGRSKAKTTAEKRKVVIQRIFGNLDFRKERTLRHGAASYILAVNCYDYYDKWASPTIKKAICSLRAAWLLGDLETEDPLGEFGDLQNMFYQKALEYYKEFLAKQEKGLESLDGIKHLGPDIDHNYGYDGILYLIAYLTLRNLPYTKKTKKEQVEELSWAKLLVSKMFGFGKSSRNKPSLILDYARDLYDELTQKIEQIQKELKQGGEQTTTSVPAS